MPSIVWTSLCLLFAVLLSAVGCAGIIGMPIAAEVETVLYAAGLFLAGFGWLLFADVPSALAPGASTDARPAFAVQVR